MPIEIRELVIKATVEQSGSSGSASLGSGAGTSNSSSEEIINMCVNKVLEILKEKNER
jgi:hypothetical protein